MKNYHDPPKKNKKELVISRQTLNRILYLGELPNEIDSYELHQYIFTKTGVKPFTVNVQRKKEKKAYAYVKFNSKDEGKINIKSAEKVRETIHLSNLGDSIIRAEYFIENNAQKKAIDNKANIIVKHLPQNITPKDLCEIVHKYGKIISIKLKQGPEGKCLGYGYVQFSSNEEAVFAIENLNKLFIEGKKIVAEKFTKIRPNVEIEKPEKNNNILYIYQLPTRVYFINIDI